MFLILIDFDGDILFAFLLLLAYLLGSIPPAVWISKYMYGKDIRTEGSGNAGSTNMYRVLGKKAGIATQIIDVVKGSLAAALPLLLRWISPATFPPDTNLETFCLICGILAVAGHIWPVFAGFRGGKGVNTLLGMMLVVNPLAAGIALLIFFMVLLSSGYVSLSSMLGTLSYPVFVLVSGVISGGEVQMLRVLLGFGVFLLVVYTHRTNIRRLMAGNENRVNLFRKKS